MLIQMQRMKSVPKRCRREYRIIWILRVSTIREPKTFLAGSDGSAGNVKIESGACRSYVVALA